MEVQVLSPQTCTYSQSPPSSKSLTSGTRLLLKGECSVFNGKYFSGNLAKTKLVIIVETSECHYKV